MQKAIVVRETGTPEVLKYEDIPLPGKLKPTQVLVKHNAIGVNYMDIYYRSGLYKAPALPMIPGIEAAGVVEAVGSALDIKIGQRVAYATAPSGAYCEKRAIDGKYLVGIPPSISDEAAVAVLSKALTAHYLLFRTYRVKKGDTILIHAAAGGVGSIMCQWAKKIGATVIGTVSTQEKAHFARSNGCDYPIVYTKEDFAQAVLKITNGQGVPVVYDSVGKDTFQKSLQSLRTFGLLVSFGQASGMVPPINILSLASKNLFVTRPTLSVYKQDLIELALSGIEVFKMVSDGVIKPQTFKKYKLADAAQAHADLENRRTRGSCILTL